MDIEFNEDLIKHEIVIIGDMTIEHKMKIHDPKRQRPFMREIMYNTASGVQGLPSSDFRKVRSFILLRGILPEDLQKRKSITVQFSYNSIAPLMEFFKSVNEWFVSEKYNRLFVYDETGNVYKIGEEFHNVKVVMSCPDDVKGQFLAAQPRIINDITNNYPGVTFKCMNGVLGNCTYTEFINLKEVMMTNLRNLFQLTSTLINQKILLGAHVNGIHK